MFIFLDKQSILRTHEILTESSGAPASAGFFYWKDLVIAISIAIILASKPTLSEITENNSYHLLVNNTICIAKKGYYTNHALAAEMLLKQHYSESNVLYQNLSSKKTLENVELKKSIALNTISAINLKLSLQTTYETENDSCYVFSVL